MKLQLLSAEAAAGPTAALHQQKNTQSHPPSIKNNSVNIPFNIPQTEHLEANQSLLTGEAFTQAQALRQKQNLIFLIFLIFEQTS